MEDLTWAVGVTSGCMQSRDSVFCSFWNTNQDIHLEVQLRLG